MNSLEQVVVQRKLVASLDGPLHSRILPEAREGFVVLAGKRLTTSKFSVDHDQIIIALDIQSVSIPHPELGFTHLQARILKRNIQILHSLPNRLQRCQEV